MALIFSDLIIQSSYPPFSNRERKREQKREREHEKECLSLYSLLSTVNKLIFIGSLKAGSYSLVMPQGLRVFIKLLPKR